MKKKGSENEYHVALYLKEKGWSIKAQNQKVEGIEIDIIAQKQKHYLLIEVKSLCHENYLEKILSQKQKNRLLNAVSVLQGYFEGNWRVFLATVASRDKKIDFFEIEN